MHLALLAAVVLAQVPLPVPYPGGAQDDYQSPTVSLVAWDKGGSEDYGPGIPAPTIDCAVGSSLSCTGAVPTYVGLGETVVLSPFWYRGDTSPRNAVRVSSSDFYRLGDTPRSGSFTEVFAFRPVLTATYIYLISKGGDAGFIARINSAGTVQIYVNGATALSCGAVSSGSWYVLTYAYERLTEGTSRIRCSLNGSAGAEVTNAGLLVATGKDLLLTDREDAPPTGHPFSGDLRKYSRFDGFAASAAQLAQMVATLWGLAHDKPAGTVATHARTDSTPCGPFSDSEMYWLGPGAPCIHAPTYQGWASGGAVAGGIEVYGIGQNKALYSADLSQAATWVPTSSGGNSISAAKNATGPDGVANSASTVTLTGSVTDPSAAYNALRQTVTVANGTPHTFSAWFKAGTYSAATFPLDMVTGGTYIAGTNCPVSAATWTRCSLTGTTTSTTALIDIGGVGFTLSGLHLTVGSGTILVYEPQLTPTAYPVPPRSTPGASSYTGTASTATTLTVPVALLNKDRFALGISATATGNWSTVNTGLLQWGGAYGAANTVSVYTDASAKIAVEVYDGAAGWRRWTADAALSGTGQKRIGVAFNAGLIRVLVDDVEVTGTMSGAGTGLLGALPSASVVVGTSGSSILRGLDARVCQANDVPGLKRCLR